jgi:hypothetical protein
MKSIYVHLNPTTLPFSKELDFSKYTFNDIPDYAFTSFNQSKKFLSEDPIIITNKDLDEFNEGILSFYNICKISFPSFYKDTFWLLTLLRLYIVYLYAKKYNINEFIHLEYDNLIYSNLKELKNLLPSLYFTRVGPFCSSAGFVYCNSIEHFTKFINKLLQLIGKGEQTVRKFTQYDHLSEMIMIDLIHDNTKDVIDYLPILPMGKGSDNFDRLGVLFDGASYGQYLGGTNNGDSKGWTGRHHYVGAAIQDKNIEVTFDKIPFIIYNNKRIPILNLHVHSKKLNTLC